MSHKAASAQPKQKARPRTTPITGIGQARKLPVALLLILLLLIVRPGGLFGSVTVRRA